jgi:hypothetical protein
LSNKFFKWERGPLLGVADDLQSFFRGFNSRRFPLVLVLNGSVV